MHIKDHATAQGWFRKHAAAPSSVGSWKAFVARNKKVQEPRTMAQEPRNMAHGGRIIGKPGGIVEPGIEYYGDNVITYTGQGEHKGKHHLRLGADKKIHRGSKEKLEKILERRKTAGGRNVPANLETFKYEEGFLTKKQFKKFLKKNHITGDDPQSFAKNHKINTKPNPLLKNHNLYDISQFNEEFIKTIQKKQVSTGQATEWAKKQFPPKTKPELHKPRYKTIVEHGGIKKGGPFTGTLDTHLGHGMNIWADKITGDTLVYTPKEINLAMSKKGGLDHKIRKVSEKIEAIKKQKIPAATKKELLEALDTTLIRLASQSQGFKKVKLSDGSTFGGNRLTIDPFDTYPGKTEVEIRDIQNKYLNKKIITQKMVDQNPKLVVTPPEEIQKIQDAYFFEKNRKLQLQAASKIGKKEQTKVIGEILTGWCNKGAQRVQEGGRIGFGGCPDSEKITNMKNAAEKLKQHDRYLRGLADTTPFADNAAAKALASKMAKSGGLLMRAGRLAFGPLTLWGEPLFEGAFVAHDILGTGTPWKEAVAKSLWAKPAISMGLLKPADQQYDEALWQVQNEEGEALMIDPYHERVRTGVKRFIDNNNKIDKLNKLYKLKQTSYIMGPKVFSQDERAAKMKKAGETYNNYLESLGGAEGVTKIKNQIENDREAYDTRVAALEVERKGTTEEDIFTPFGSKRKEKTFDIKQKQAEEDLMYQQYGKTRVKSTGMPGTPGEFKKEWIIDPKILESEKEVWSETKTELDKMLKQYGDEHGYGWTPYGLGYGMEQRYTQPGIGDRKYNEDLGYRQLLNSLYQPQASGGRAGYTNGGLTRTVAPDSEGIMSLKKKKW